MNQSYRFRGFTGGSVVSLPDQLFSELVPHLNDPDELKVVLHVLWRLARMRSSGAPWITDQEVRSDAVLRDAFRGESGLARLDLALANSIEHEILLAVPWQAADGTVERRYFANSPQGRATVAALDRGAVVERSMIKDRPNIYTLYEQNIGPLTALLGEELAEAEETYPAAWIEEAFREAVRLNKRNWKYILAILTRWQNEGRGAEEQYGVNRGPGREAGKRDREEETRRYIEDAYDRIVKHGRG